MAVVTSEAAAAADSSAASSFLYTARKINACQTKGHEPLNTSGRINGSLMKITAQR